MFCSSCGRPVTVANLRICRDCGTIYCEGCLRNPIHESILSFNITDEGKKIPVCHCKSNRIEPLDEINSSIARDLIDYKTILRQIAHTPIAYMEEFRELRLKLEQLEAEKFVFFPDTFSPSCDLNATLNSIEAFISEYLADFQPSLQYLYSIVLTNNLYEFADNLNSAQFRTQILSNRLKSFESDTNDQMKILFTDLKHFMGIEDNARNNRNWLRENFSNWQDELLEGEKIIGLKEVKIPGLIRSGYFIVLFTTLRIILFKHQRKLLKKEYVVLKSIELQKIRESYLKERRFKSPLLAVETLNDQLRLITSHDDIYEMIRWINLASQVPMLPSVSEWKIWSLFWSPEKYRLTIYDLLNLDHTQRLEELDDKNYNPIEGSDDKHKRFVQHEEIKNYLMEQIDRVQNQILTAKQFLHDLVNRKKEISLQEYYELYNNFTLKLENLEDQRDELIKQYKKVSTS